MKKNNTAHNIIALLISQVLVKCLGILYKLYLANKDGFGDVGNAIYNSGYQIYALLLTISTIGVPNLISKTIAENRNNNKMCGEIIKNAFVIFSIIGVLGGIFLAFSSGFIAKNILNIPEAKMSIIALSPAIFNVCVISVMRGYFNGINEIETTAKSQTIEQLLKTICTITFVELGYVMSSSNIAKIAAIANLATTVATFGCLIYLWKKNTNIILCGNISISKMLGIIKLTIPISLSAILASLNKNIDSITIVRYMKKFVGESIAKKEYGMMSGKIDVIASMPVSFIIAISTTIIPNIAKNKDNVEYIRNISHKYFKLLGIIIIPCSILLYIYSGKILLILFGSDNGKMLLQINAISLLFISAEQIINAILHGIGCIYTPAISLTIGVCIKAILNILFLKVDPKSFWYGGTIGCSLATLTCHFVAFAIVFVKLLKKLKIK